MAGENQGTPPANNDGNELATLRAAVAELTKTVGTLATSQSELAKNVNTIADTVTKLPPASTASGAKSGGNDEIASLKSTVAELTKSIEGMANASKSDKANAARDSYLGEKLKDLPAAYRAKLGSDPTKWAAEEQSIRDEFKADLKAQGVEPKQLGNANKDGGTTADKQPVDRSKMSPMDLLNSDTTTK